LKNSQSKKVAINQGEFSGRKSSRKSHHTRFLRTLGELEGEKDWEDEKTKRMVIVGGRVRQELQYEVRDFYRKLDPQKMRSDLVVYSGPAKENQN